VSALVVGGGFAGLAAAIALRASGVPVTLVEHQSDVGGKARALRTAGATVDVGPTILVDPAPLRALLWLAGADADEAPLERVDPVALVTFSNGTAFHWAATPDATAEAVADLGPHARDDWARFLDVGARAARLAARFVERGDVAGPHDLWRLVAGGGVPVGDLVPFVRHPSLAALLAARIRTPALRRWLGHFARFVGLEAHTAPAVTLVIPYLVATSGAWYPRGGFAALASRLGRLAEDRGVVMALGTPVERLEATPARVVAVTAGRRIVAARGVSAVDVVTTAAWLGPEMLRRTAGRLTPASSTVVAWWVVQGHAPIRTHHAFHFADDGEPLYVATPTVSDPTLAPPGVDIVYALLHVPPGTTLPRRLGALLRRRVEAHGQWPGGPVLAEGVEGGGPSCYGYRIGPGLFRSFRPSQRVPGLPLAMAGGSVFPGPGVANALRSGLRAAALLGGASRAESA
jgi:diapolycopene oxygenase